MEIRLHIFLEKFFCFRFLVWKCIYKKLVENPVIISRVSDSKGKYSELEILNKRPWRCQGLFKINVIIEVRFAVVGLLEPASLEKPEKECCSL